MGAKVCLHAIVVVSKERCGGQGPWRALRCGLSTVHDLVAGMQRAYCGAQQGEAIIFILQSLFGTCTSTKVSERHLSEFGPPSAQFCSCFLGLPKLFCIAKVGCSGWSRAASVSDIVRLCPAAQNNVSNQAGILLTWHPIRGGGTVKEATQGSLMIDTNLATILNCVLPVCEQKLHVREATAGPLPSLPCCCSSYAQCPTGTHRAAACTCHTNKGV